LKDRRVPALLAALTKLVSRKGAINTGRLVCYPGLARIIDRLHCIDEAEGGSAPTTDCVYASLAATTRPTPSPGNLFGVKSTVTKINALPLDPGYWNNGDSIENADTVLHELGHVLRDIGFTSGDFQ
jgi:hypothetical protein